MRTAIFLLLLLAVSGCALKPALFENTSLPEPPDYNNTDHWASLPGKDDLADLTPGTEYPEAQATATADVFFIHPTIFTKKSTSWNASLSDNNLNKETDESTIKYQASIFNAAGRIYAPRYRQAHIRAFFSDDKKSSAEALDIAYSDVKTAFEYYLKHFNHGRPILIAAHSQGSVHGLRLVKEYFDGTELGDKLVAAYLIGWPLPLDSFASIPPCESETQTGCVCSWRTWLWGHLPKRKEPPGTILVTNPLTWTTTPDYAPAELHKGAVLRKFNEIYAGIADAKIEGNVLWIHKPKFPGSFLFRRKNYHVGDFNLFYLDVRHNAALRTSTFGQKQ